MCGTYRGYLRRKAGLMRGLFVFILWILFSLVAISFVGDHPYWALVLAIGGGIYLGWEVAWQKRF